MTQDRPELPARLLMGPGPMNIHPRVYQALGAPVIGHLDPAYLQILDLLGDSLRRVFRTANRLTHATPGTGTSGMEACVSNLLEPGDRIIVCVNGYFGDRIRQMAERQEAEVVVIAGEWGTPADPELVERELSAGPCKVVALVHAETSTGVLQPMDDIARLARDHGSLLLLDAVTSLGGVDVLIDEWGVDAAYSCSQKCIGCPPGLAPVTFSERALGAVRGRSHPVRSWYLDISLLEKYWGPDRIYHHTSSSTLNYALLEALMLIEEEGLANRIGRHLKNHRMLVAGIEGMGLEMLVAPPNRLPTLNAVRIPHGVDDMRVRAYLLQNYNLEIGGGLGTLKGKIWRVGLMGYVSSAENVLFFLTALNRALAAEGVVTRLDEAVEAAVAVAC